MGTRLTNFVARLNAAVDWFIPADLKQSPGTLQAVRMFLFSHLFGPLLGHTISLSMLYVGGGADLSWWIFFLAVTAFWPFPFVLRLTGWYVPLALLSVENLMFCIFWGCYQYGGISSPIMPWLVTVPLLAFFYLPERKTRIIVAILIIANLALFYEVYDVIGFPETVAPNGLVILGLISTFCASVYVSMMALYFASIVFSQGELEREIHHHQATERRLRDATGQARRALMAKSDFLAKLSHELKNPLNAVIGYSEILIEDLGGTEMQKRKDLTSIRSAGSRLLGLIDALLELSRLEAGKAELRIEEMEFADFFENMVVAIQPIHRCKREQADCAAASCGTHRLRFAEAAACCRRPVEQCREVHGERSHHVFGFDAGRLVERIDRGHWGWDRAGATGEPIRDLRQFRTRNRKQIR